jgi:S-layer homology domain
MTNHNTPRRGPGKTKAGHFIGRTAAGLATGALLASVVAVPADGALSSTGPINPDNGYPTWYMDQGNPAAGLAPLQLELCLDGPLCLATAERPNPEAPVSFPDNFPGEAFWWAGEADIAAGDTSALLVMAQEAAFGGASEEIIMGEQVAFNRLRIRIDGLDPNTSYTVTHPYGSLALTSDATGVINYTSDIGCFDLPCTQAAFDRALAGDVGGPFLRWPSGAPAGYIGDPAVPHTVVGSPTGNNFFQIDGPNAGGPGVSSIRTDQFAIQGKLAGPFVDVATTDQFAAEITWLKESGITTGFPNQTFQPFSSVNRAAMAAFLYRFSGDTTYVAPAVSPYTDVPTNHQFYKEIMWLTDQGITQGMTATTFAPQVAVNRKDMAAFLYRFNGEPEFAAPAASPFTDVATTGQFYKEIMWLRDAAITNGMTPTTYAPMVDVNRKDMAAFLFRYDAEFNGAAEAPAEEAPAEEAPAEEAPAEEAPADEAPADEAPADEAPADDEAAL